MRYPQLYYHILQALTSHLQMSRRYAATFALWVLGSLLAESARETRLVASLAATPRQANSLRQRLRKLLKADWQPYHYFAALLAWLITLAQPQTLVLVLDTSLASDQLCLLCVSFVYRNSAIPVAWRVLAANQKGEWVLPYCELLSQLSSAVAPQQQVLVLIDRGLRSHRLWQKIVELGWHALVREQYNIKFAPCGQHEQQAHRLVSQPGQAWVGEGVAFSAGAQQRRRASLIVIWVAGQAQPWVLLTSLPAAQVCGSWYSWRMAVEVGFGQLKSRGWDWERLRRRELGRVARHLLVLAVAELYTLGYGTREEDAHEQGLTAAELSQAPSGGYILRHPRPRSVFAQGRSLLKRMLVRGTWLAEWWLRPEYLPPYPSNVSLSVHQVEDGHVCKELPLLAPWGEVW